MDKAHFEISTYVLQVVVFITKKEEVVKKLHGFLLKYHLNHR